MQKFYFYHVALPLMTLVFTTIALDYFRLDLVIADHIYSFSGDAWSLKNSVLLENYIHKGGRTLSILFLLTTLAAIVISHRIDAIRQYLKGFIYIAVAVVLSTTTVSLLKAVTNISCPWSFLRYGGDEPSVKIFPEIFRAGTGRCFPAGHASAGYAWIALYFFCWYYFPKRRYLGLALGLVPGAIFGFAQQLRGAHFLSHDLWTLAICWFLSLICSRIMLPGIYKEIH